MQSYTIHEHPTPPSERIDRGERLMFVKDGFSVFAAAFSPVWMIANGLWLVLLGYLVLLAGLQIAFEVLGAGSGTQAAVALGLNLLVGFEADSLKRWTLGRRGWQIVGTVTGENRTVCERRFFEAWLGSVPAVDTGRFAGFETTPADPSRARIFKDGDPGVDVSRPTPKSWRSISSWRRGS